MKTVLSDSHKFTAGAMPEIMSQSIPTARRLASWARYSPWDFAFIHLAKRLKLVAYQILVYKAAKIHYSNAIDSLFKTISV